MDLEEALRELGVERSVDRDVARRAYLRLLKHHKPEVDPKGFARLREAWELVDRFLSFHLLQAEYESEDREPSEGEETRHPNHPPDAASPSDPLAEYRRRLAALPEDAEWPEYAAIGQQAVAAHPDEVAAHELLITTLQGAPHGEIAEAMRAATSRGLSGFFEALVWNLPNEATDDEIERAKEHSDAPIRLVAAMQLARRERPREGLAIFQDLLHTATETSEARLPPQLALRMLLALHASGDLDSARAAGAGYRRYLEQAGRDDAPQGFLAATWVLIQELELLPSSFPQSLRQALVRGLKKGDLGEASTQAEVYVHTKGARRAKKHLQDLVETPNIANILGLGETEQFRSSSPGDGLGSYWWVIAIVIILSRLGAGNCSESDRGESDRGEPDWANLRTATPRIHTESTVRLFEEARSDLLSVCKEIPGSTLCDKGKAARRALFEGRCDDALALLEDETLRLDGGVEYFRWADRGFSTLRNLHMKLCMSRFPEP